MSDNRSRTELLLLVNILNTMYNDNLRQINNLTNTLDNLNRSNNRIQDMLVQLLANGGGEHRYQNSPPVFNNNVSRRRNNTITTNNTSFPLLSLSNMNSGTRASTSRDNNDMFYRIIQALFTPEPHLGLNSGVNVFQDFFNPVEVYPTPAQIEAATRRVRYSDITRPINTSCPISMEDFEDNDNVTVIRECGHIFNTEHLSNWFRTNCRCPVCRYDIREYSNGSTSMYNMDASGNGRRV